MRTAQDTGKGSSAMSMKLHLPKRMFMGAALIVAAAAAFTASLSKAQSASEKVWAGLGGSADNSRYFSGQQITKTNVSNLQVAWNYPYGETGFAVIVAHGVIYGRGRGGSLVALDAKTGKEIWVREGMNGMTTRGINYWESSDGSDRRLIFCFSDYLQELDARTGKPITNFGNKGVVDLREGLGRDPSTVGRVQSGTPGEVFENLIILGSAPGEGYLSPPGDLRAFNVLTGKQEWIFHTVPHPGEFGYDTWPKDAYKYVGGTNTWGELSIDTARGIAYFPLGSPTFDYYGADRIGQNLFGSSLLALDARTGKRLWHFQMVHHDLWDFDGTAAPQLTTMTRNGQKRDVVAMAGKTGFLYVFDRVTGEAMWPIEERQVPKSDMPGEQSWPTQPFVVGLPPFAKQSAMTIQELNPYDVITPAQRQDIADRLAKAKNSGIFTPITLGQETVHIPGNNGGALFGTTSSDPATGSVYVISQDNPAFIKLYEPRTQGGRGGGGGGGGGAPSAGQVVYTRECAVCHGADRGGTDAAPTLLAITQRLNVQQIRDVLTNGKGRMPAFVHLTATDTDQILELLGTQAGAAGGAGGGGGRGGGGGGGGGGRGGGAAPNFAPLAPGVLVGSGPVMPRDVGRGGAAGRGEPPYPEGVPDTTRYSINGMYGTITSSFAPPYTKIYKYDLNTGTIKWSEGFGDDPALAARGIFNTGTTQMRNAILVTAGGVLLGAGRDGYVRAWDADTGQRLWQSPVGGNTVGQPAIYEVDGKAYFLVAAGPAQLVGTQPADGLAGGRGRGNTASSLPIAPIGPVGYVVFTLPSGN